MLRRRCIEAALVASLLNGCTTMLGSGTSPPATSTPSAVWVQNPRAFAEDIASSGEQERERLRGQALAEFLKAPGAQQQLHLNLVYDASVQTLADCDSAAVSITHALGDGGALPVESRAVLTDILLRIERRVDDLRTVASRESELAALRDAYTTLEQRKAASDAQYAGAQRALREAQAKLDALKSIEQTLESNTPPPPSEMEPQSQPEGQP
jgi:hypothetical protein